jgi:hypothetical protein
LSLRREAPGQKDDAGPVKKDTFVSVTRAHADERVSDESLF